MDYTTLRPIVNLKLTVSGWANSCKWNDYPSQASGKNFRFAGWRFFW